MATTSAPGTQSIRRAVTLLKELAARGRQGWRLVDLAHNCGLDKGTTHRMLAYLASERLVRQRASDRHYLPGPLLFELGLALHPHAEFFSACSTRLERLVQQPGDAAYLYLRSGNEFICANRVGQSAGASIEAGARRPLLLSAGGMAILVGIPRQEANRIVATNLQQLSNYSAQDKRKLMRMLSMSRQRGYGINFNDVAKVNAYAVPVRDAEGAVFASISLRGPAARYGTPAGERRVLQMLRAEAEAVGHEAAHVFSE